MLTTATDQASLKAFLSCCEFKNSESKIENSE